MISSSFTSVVSLRTCLFFDVDVTSGMGWCRVQSDLLRFFLDWRRV